MFAFAILLFCFLGPLFWRVDPDAISAGHLLAAPSLQHPAGTDELGRDQLARLMQGGAATLAVALPAAALGFACALLYGLLAGMGPALLDRALMRVLDAVLALPALLVLLCVAAMLPITTPTLIVLIGVTAWPAMARLVRNEVLAIRQRDYVSAARQLGAGPLHIARRHLIPVMGTLLAVQATFLVADSILALSSLSFLGLGVPPPQASWGAMLQSGLMLIDLNAWWLILPPGLLIVASLFTAAALGNHLLARRPA